MGQEASQIEDPRIIEHLATTQYRVARPGEHCRRNRVHQHPKAIEPTERRAVDYGHDHIDRRTWSEQADREQLQTRAKTTRVTRSDQHEQSNHDHRMGNGRTDLCVDRWPKPRKAAHCYLNDAPGDR